MRNYLHASAHAAIAIASCCASAALAQETTSSIRGTVTAGGAPVAGAAVTITHVPSGTVATSSTGPDGSFGASGLRVGGPFTVAISAAGYADASVTDISLTAGQPLRLPIALEPQGQEIVVTAARSRAIELSSGPITVLDRRAIEGVASVSRDIRDIVRRDPFATIDPGQSRGVIIAGQNARLNKFSVDGLRFSDNFGLNVGGLPTARGPVPLDAIEQLSVKVAPYDISEGDFQGGAINVVLRSGTNTLHGSGFYTYTDDGLTGKRTRIDTAVPTGRIALNFKSKTYGGFLSGPIVKDKLFLALSYEHLAEGNPIAIGTAGFPQVVPGLTQAQIDAVTSIASSVYSYAAGGVQSTTLETDEKYTAKLDWNITNGQRLSLTYIHNNSANSAVSNNSTNPVSPTLSLASNNYRRPEKVDSYVGQLNSDWSSKFHTELRGNYRKYDLTPVPFGAFNFAQFVVCTDPTATTLASGAANTNAFTCSQGSSAAPGATRLYIGPDNFRHFNYVRTKQYGADAAVRWEYRNFSMKATAAWSHLDVANAFTPNALGNYYFDSLADLQNKRAGSLALAGSITGNLNDVLASFKYDQYTFGFQTSWDASDTLNITAGERVDLYGGIAAPPLNTYFLARNGFTNTHVIDGKYVAQPRISATWSPTPRLRLRGGFGLFAGGSPDVYLGNSYSQANVFGNSFTISRNADGTCTLPTPTICAAALNNVSGSSFSSVLTDYLRTNTGSLALANVNAMDPHYQLESTWKATFSADYKTDLPYLGSNWNFGGDLYYGWVKNAPLYVDLRLARSGTAPDGRARYTSVTPTSANMDLLLTNSKQGHSLVAIARIDKGFSFGLNAGVSFTFQDITDQSAVNGTTGAGTYGGTAMVDPNIAAYGTSTYQIRNSWKFNLDYDHAFFGDYKTRFSLFGELRSGLPYSITMTDLAGANGHGNAFGAAGTNNRYLLYVPLSGTDPIVTYAAGTQAALDAVINAYGLGKYRGKILPKNSQRAPNWFKVDLHAEQELPIPLATRLASGARVRVFADVENVLNLLNHNWGSLRQVAFPYLSSVVNVACVASGANGCAQYLYSNPANPQVLNQGRVSLWAVRFGGKVEF